MGNYNELEVWRKSVDLAVAVYRATRNYPRAEIFGLRMQMRRAAVSVQCNIAEGQGRSTPKDYRHFVLQARGSVLELQTQIVISEELNFIDALTRNEFEKLSRRSRAHVERTPSLRNAQRLRPNA